MLLDKQYIQNHYEYCNYCISSTHVSNRRQLFSTHQMSSLFYMQCLHSTRIGDECLSSMYSRRTIIARGWRIALDYTIIEYDVIESNLTILVLSPDNLLLFIHYYWCHGTDNDRLLPSNEQESISRNHFVFNEISRFLLIHSNTVFWWESNCLFSAVCSSIFCTSYLFWFETLYLSVITLFFHKSLDSLRFGSFWNCIYSKAFQELRSL